MNRDYDQATREQKSRRQTSASWSEADDVSPFPSPLPFPLMLHHGGTPMPPLHDPDLPTVSELTDVTSARRLLEAALSDVGRQIRAVEISEVVYRPGRRCLVRYTAEIDNPAGTVQLVAVTGSPLPEAAVRLRSGSEEVVVWAFPDDPALPGLPHAMNHDIAAALLTELGVRPSDLRLGVRSYRPGRRAVIEAQTADQRLYLKVVRPSKAEALNGVHRRLAGHVPVPRAVGWSSELGVVVLEPLPGTPVATLLAQGRAELLPSADDLTNLLDLIARSGFEGRRRPAPHERLDEHCEVVVAIAPALGGMVAHLRRAVSEVPAEPEIVAHRDFHASQLMIAEGALRLVDIDTVGPGTRADDMAVLIAQLECLARPGPQEQSIKSYAATVLDRFEQVVPPESLRPRIAAAIAGFAVGPFRTQEAHWRRETRRRIEAAVAWAGSAAAP